MQSRQLLVWLLIVSGSTILATKASAQSRSPYAPQNNRDVYSLGAYRSPTVSPYVNLGVGTNGISNYQTIVKPMLDDREALRVQADTLQMLRQQLRDSREPKGGSPGTSNQPSVRFMHYSHFYGSGR